MYDEDDINPVVKASIQRLVERTGCTSYQAAKALKAMHNVNDAANLILLVKDIARQNVVDCEHRQ